MIKNKQDDLIKRYATAWGNALGFLTVLQKIIEEDYPNPAHNILIPSEFQISMLAGLAGSLSALIDGHERQ